MFCDVSKQVLIINFYLMIKIILFMLYNSLVKK